MKSLLLPTRTDILHLKTADLGSNALKAVGTYNMYVKKKQENQKFRDEKARKGLRDKR